MIESLLSYVYKVPIIGGVIKEFFSLSYAFRISIFLLGILGVSIKKALDVYVFNKLSNIGRYITSNKKYSKKREDFYEGSTTLKFIDWQNRILKIVYSDYKLLSVFNKEYPIIIFDTKKKCTYPFKDFFLEYSTLKSLNIPDFKLDKHQKFYMKMMGETIKWPNLIGFELDKFFLDEENKIENFTANVCKYQHNVVTSHILEYELYKHYRKNEVKLLESSPEAILNSLQYRKKIHSGKSQTEVVTTGCNRHSLLSIQMLVVYYDDDLDNYRVLVFQRSKDVAIKPNYWQIVPAGGFEIFEKEETTNSYIIQQNFNIELVLFRELLEEVFNGEDFQYNKHGNIKEIINNHEDIVQIREWLKNGDANLEFVGNVVDLVSLRSELSFVLAIDNPEFAKKKFKINHEGKDLQTIIINDLPHMLEKELLYPSSAGLLKLAMKSQCFKERNLLQEFVE